MTDDCAARTIEDELAIAHRALRDGDLGHAAFHIASALATDPASAEAAAVFDGWFTLSDNPLALVEGGKDANWEGWVAMRARTFAKLGRAEDALPALVMLAQAAPEKAYLGWLPLLKNVGQVSDAVAERAANGLLALAGSLPEPIPADHASQPTVKQALGLLAEWRETKRQLAAPLHAIVIFSRKLGKLDAALVAARALYELRPDWRSIATLSSTLRVSGDLEGALGMARRGTRIAPPEGLAATWLDVGDLCLELDRASEAREAYGAALELEPENAWARSGLPYARFREDGNEADRDALRQWWLAHPEDRRALQLLRRIGEPLLDVPFVPADATAKVFAQLQHSFLDSPPTSRPFECSLALSAPEAPSNFLAVGLLEQAFGLEIALRLSLASVPSPDPREPSPGAELALWRRSGDSFEPALAPPDENVRRELGLIAATPYHLTAWAERARILGEALGPARVGDLLSTMVHPPPLPHRGYDTSIWIHSVQVAAALVIANVDRGSDWAGSTRRKTLLSLARGPVDWSVTASIIALMWSARSEPGSVSDVAALFAELRRRETLTASYAYEVPLRQAWLLLPDLDSTTRSTLTGELASFLGEVTIEPAGPPPDAAARFPNPEPGWRRPATWAVALASFLLPLLWPESLGDWWMLGTIVGFGVAWWIWTSGVEPLPRGT